jgi:hypothetical protein
MSRLQLSGEGLSSGGRSSNQCHGHGSGRGGGRGRDGGSGSGSKPPTGGNGKKKKTIAGDECKYCGKSGHWARECRKKKRDEAAHAAQAEEEYEAALNLGVTSLDEEATGEELFAQLGDTKSGGCAQWVLTEDPEPVPVHWVFQEEDADPVPFVALATASVTTSAPPPSMRGQAPIHVIEDKLFIQLSEKSEGGSTRWILDTGATNHMTGERSFFSELDTGVHGTVHFGDGSVVAIEGRGTILFKLKSGEHQELAGVYYIPS